MHTFSASSLLSSSFYVRMAISPCGRYLSCGNSGNGYGTHIFDVSAPSARRVYGETKRASAILRGHTHEVGGIDWANDAVSRTINPGLQPSSALLLTQDNTLRDSSPPVEMTC